MTTWSRLNRNSLNALAATGLLVLPIGSTEQHGDHLPSGTDSMHVEHIAKRAAQIVSAEFPIVLAPTLTYGVSTHHLPFGGTLSLRPSTLRGVLLDLGHSIAESQFSRMFMLNGHGGNHHIVQACAAEISQLDRIHVGAGSWWDIAAPGLMKDGAYDTGRVPGHAGTFETSVMKALAPELVGVTVARESRMLESHPSRATGHVEEHPEIWNKSGGVSDDASRASEVTGQRYVETAISAVADAFRKFYTNANTQEKD